ncbi:MAG: PorV/PorQ family protein [Candidatus Krumholzibacteria bacterium]|nr:PorV/PorQ family protein [Candidatus Krumholzibacteria bacterium]
MRIILATLCLTTMIFLSGTVQAEKYAGEFMALGGGARAMALGGAFIAVADDATASFWNPAGMAGLYSAGVGRRDWEMNFMHSERFGELIDYNYFSAAFPLRPGESSWGVTIIHMGIDGIPIIPFTSGMIENSDGDDRFEPWAGERPNFNPLDFPMESVNDFALFLSYAQVMSFADLGVSLKIIRSDQVTDVSSFGLGIDIGLLKRHAWRDLAVGVKLQDATGTYISWSTGKREFIYPALKVGVAYPFDIKSMNSTLLVACDGDFRYENLKGVSQLWIGEASADFHFGAELLIREMVALRGGYDMGRPTAGAGFVLEDFGPWNISLGIDYALLVHDELDNTHRVSLMISH